MSTFRDLTDEQLLGIAHRNANLCVAILEGRAGDNIQNGFMLAYFAQCAIDELERRGVQC